MTRYMQHITVAMFAATVAMGTATVAHADGKTVLKTMEPSKIAKVERETLAMARGWEGANIPETNAGDLDFGRSFNQVATLPKTIDRQPGR